jgi:hypothetical protein
MYLDAANSNSYAAANQRLWYDLTGKNTGLDCKVNATGFTGVYPTFNSGASPKSLSFPGGVTNQAGGEKDSTKASGAGLSYLACTTAGATVIWWQNGNSGQSSNFFNLTNGTVSYSVLSYTNPAATVGGLRLVWPGIVSGPYYSSASLMTITGWNMYAVVYGPSDVKIYQNNSLIETVFGGYGYVNAALSTPTRLSISGNDAGFTMGALLFYNTALDTTNLSAVWNNLRGRFGK